LDRRAYTKGFLGWKADIRGVLVGLSLHAYGLNMDDRSAEQIAGRRRYHCPAFGACYRSRDCQSVHVPPRSGGELMNATCRCTFLPGMAAQTKQVSSFVGKLTGRRPRANQGEARGKRPRPTERITAFELPLRPESRGQSSACAGPALRAALKGAGIPLQLGRTPGPLATPAPDGQWCRKRCASTQSQGNERMTMNPGTRQQRFQRL